MTVMEQALKAALANQPNPTLLIKPQMQRIWEWLKDHPDSSAKAVLLALKIPANSVSSLLSALEKRGMLTKTQVPTHKGSQRHILVYRTSPTLREYELLPKLKDGKKASVAAPQVQAEAKAVAAVPAQAPATQPSKTGYKDFVEGLTVAEARKLYKELHQLFGN